MSQIQQLYAREIIDSRGYPTVECEITLTTGHVDRASVPSGASTGMYEAHELRDGDKNRYFSKGVNNAVHYINSEINDTISGFEITEQGEIDKTLINLDGTKNKKRLGANSILAVSLACAKVAAKYTGVPLFKYIGGMQNSLPTPMMNIINGGCHANNKLDFQEFMIIPCGFSTFKESLRAGCEIFHTLKDILSKKNYSTSVGDEGGFSPDISSNKECLDLIIESIEKANYRPGEDVFLGLDVAASEMYSSKKYNLSGESLLLNSEKLIKYYENLVENFPIISIEDGLDENDWTGWKLLTQTIGHKCQLVGDDLFVTSTERLKEGIQRKSGNSILIKLNQIGSLSETINTIKLAKKNSFNTIISHRSGETEETFISDFAVGISAGQIKTGSLSRSERVSKYNQLLRIEDQSEHIEFSGKNPFQSFLK